MEHQYKQTVEKWLVSHPVKAWPFFLELLEEA
jgi:hypothetical protein